MNSANILNRHRGLADRPTGDLEEYSAFSPPSPRQQHLEILRRLPAATEAPSNVYLEHIMADVRFGTNISLLYTGRMLVVLKGRSLTPLFRRLLAGEVGRVQEFDPYIHLPVTDEETAVIESIEIQTHRPEPAPPKDRQH